MLSRNFSVIPNNLLRACQSLLPKSVTLANETNGVTPSSSGDGDTVYSVLDPANNSPVAFVSAPGDAKKATAESIEKAERCLSTLSATNSVYRSKLLSNWATSIRSSREALAHIMTLECGKPIAESLAEVEYGASYLDYYAGECMRPNGMGGGTIIPSPFFKADGQGVANVSRGTIQSINSPVGVCGFITPWNFPLAMITRKVGPALSAGCPSVLKPSDVTPLTALALLELSKGVGLPEGAFEVLPFGADDASVFGEEICSSDVVKVRGW